MLRTQSKRASLAEAITNTTIGFCLSWGATLSFMYLLGITMSFHQLWWYTWFMTLVSVVRSYALRRMFNAEFWKRWMRVPVSVVSYPRQVHRDLNGKSYVIRDSARDYCLSREEQAEAARLTL